MMRPGKRWFAAPCCVLLCLLSVAAGGEDKPPEDKRVEVKLRVVDVGGGPIAGAVIQAWEADTEQYPSRSKLLPLGEGQAVRTGSDGAVVVSFTMAANAATSRGPKPRFCITAQAPEHLVNRSGSIDTDQSDHFEVELTLRRLVTFEGRVIDEEGRPVSGATVFHTGNASPRVEVESDAKGRFRLGGIPEGKSPIFVEHPQFHFHGQLLDTAAGPQDLRLLGKDQTPPPRATLPPLLSREEELGIARRVIGPALESALKSSDEGEKCWQLECCACLDPWDAFDKAEAHLTKSYKSRFVVRQLPRLYVADPDNALAVLESLDEPEHSKAWALLMTVRRTPGLSRQQKLELLERAAQHSKATVEPDERVYRLSTAALRLHELGMVREAKQIVDEVLPTARQLSNDSRAACAAAGEALSLFDLPAGIRLIESMRDEEYGIIHVANRLAASDPAEAERIAAEYLNVASEGYRAFCRKTYQRDPTEEERLFGVMYSEARLMCLCYRMAATDPDRAERIAGRMQDPYFRAYALGMLAKALVPTDRPRARAMILRAYEILSDAAQNPRRCWLQWVWSGPTAPEALLPVAEEIDPTLVEECMWRAVSFRLHRPADDFLESLEPEWKDAVLAFHVARYDRQLATAIFPPRDKKIVPPPQVDRARPLDVLAVINPRKALEELGDGAKARARDRQMIVEMLSVVPRDRWSAYSLRYYLWTPDEPYYESSFSW